MKIKICGITSEAEAIWLNEQKVDFAGFVQFFPRSKRNISVEEAAAVMAVLDPGIAPVAVTVSPTGEQIRRLAEAGFAYIQIHGDVEDELIETCPLPVIRAFNVKDMAQAQQFCSRYRNMDKIAGFVLDAQTPGSGKTFDWVSFKENGRYLFEKPDKKFVLLAGGLTPENVAEAIRITGADGVDTSSGVEKEDGFGKDPDKIRRFVENARHAAL